MKYSLLYWQKMEELLCNSQIIIDRQKGTAHPRYPSKIYPLDYGYLQSTRSGDNAGIDVWVGSLNGHTLTGILCTLDMIKKDAEIKLLSGCSDQDIDIILSFFEESMHWIYLKNPQGNKQ